MNRRLVVAIAVVVTAALLPSAGFGSSHAGVRGTQSAIPTGLADAIRARLGAGRFPPGAAAPGLLGVSVSLSADGTTALVGAPGSLVYKGAAYIFHASDAGSWSSTDVPTAVLMNNAGPASAQMFGVRVALSADGTTAFVGAPEGGAKRHGAIYVFHASAEDAWASTSSPTATLTVPLPDLGYSLSVSADGTTLIAGSPLYNLLAGGAYVFHVSSESAWVSSSTPTAVLSNAGEDPADYLMGEAVAISADGTTALVSDDQNPSGAGAAVYHASGENAWTSSSAPNAIVSDPSWAPAENLGPVALSGDGTVAFVADAGANSNAGAVDVFHASGAWTSTSTPTATLSHGGPGRYFGVAVAVSTDGTTALVTAPSAHGMRGAAYVFHVSDEGSWVSSSAPTATLTNSAALANDSLGSAGALSGDGATALAGAPGVRFDTGAADVFHVSAASSWASSVTPDAILTVAAMNRCVVPSLKGLKVGAAKSVLKARSCRLGKVSRVARPKAKTDRIVSQSRAPGLRLPVGTKVNVKIAK